MELNWWQRMFPERALRREIARQRIQAVRHQGKRYYDAAQHSQYRPKSLQDDASPNAVAMNGVRRLRSYARNLDENHHIAIAILDSLVNNIVGCGLVIQPMVKNVDGTLNERGNEQIRQLLADWYRFPTADKQTDFGTATRLICRTWLRDGEMLIQKLRGTVPGYDHRTVLPYSLELLEPDYLPFELNKQTPRIVQGVELTQFYEPTAYYLSKDHPGDIWNAQYGMLTNESDYRRIPADRIMHLKFTRRVNQVRGVTLLHGVIRALEDLNNYEESERIAARIAAAFTAFIKRSPDAQTTINPDTGERDLEMSPGMIFDNLLPGEEIGTIDTSRPNTEVNNFVGGQIRRIAAGSMSSYSTISRDYDGSYSSQRQALVEAKPNYDTLRGYLVQRFIIPVYKDLIDLAVTTGALKIPQLVKRDTLYDMVVPNTAMPWIDPKKEVEADVLRINNALASRSQVIAERGGDPQAVSKQRKNDEVLFDGMDTQPAGGGQTSGADAPAEEDTNAEA